MSFERRLKGYKALWDEDQIDVVTEFHDAKSQDRLAFLAGVLKYDIGASCEYTRDPVFIKYARMEYEVCCQKFKS